MLEAITGLSEFLRPPRERRWSFRRSVRGKHKLSRYDPYETGPGDHNLSPATIHLREALYLHGSGRCFFFSLPNDVLTLLVVRDSDGVRKYTLIVRVADILLSDARVVIQDGASSGLALLLDQTFAGAAAPERFVEDHHPDYNSNEFNLHYTFQNQEYVKQIMINPGR